jgi:Tfp pilus assembly protein PilV
MMRLRTARGLTLIEAMLLVVIMSIVAVGAGVGLQAVAKVPTQTDDIMAQNNALVETLEDWKSKTWANMTVAPTGMTILSTSATQTVLSGPVSINRKDFTRTVTVESADPAATTDPDTFTAANLQSDFRRITAEINGRKMRVYVTQP